MLFCSERFLVFFLVVFGVHWLLPWPRARLWWLLGASLWFYASWNAWLALLVVASTTLDWGLARAIGATGSPRGKGALLAVSVAANLGLLAYFKYANFFLRSIEEAVAAAGGRVALPLLSVILPIGISFYTFEAISYVTDVYRGRIRPEPRLERFLLFITFFPHLVAGPIVRAPHFLPQLRRPKLWRWARMHLGVQLFLLGVFKKMAIADRMALWVDPVFADPSTYGGAALWAALIAYPVQIYCDFSGYTDMALGSAHLLGYKLPRNFDLPYLARNVAEYWRRWHITLSNWLRDYLFVPLGGSRGGEWRTARNLFLTMVLGGLWHGAAATFVVWGAAHGVYLVLHRAFRIRAERSPALKAALESGPGTVLRIAGTFGSIALLFVVFRSPSFAVAGEFYRGLVDPRGAGGLPYPAEALALLLGVVALAHAAGAADLWRRVVDRASPLALGAAYAAAASAALLLAPDAGKAFIYFQF